MRKSLLLTAVIAVALAAVVTGCGADDKAADSPTPSPTTAASSPEDSGSPGDAAGAAGGEQITPGAVALVVRDHLGRDVVRRFVTYDDEPGSVGVMVRLRDRTPHNFAVSIYSPEQAQQFGPGGCPPRQRQHKGEECETETLEDGTTVTVQAMSQGFSDDNAEGSVVLASAVTPEDGVVVVMYESYDDTPLVRLEDLKALITDPRLTWLTDPAVNKQGEAMAVKEL